MSTALRAEFDVPATMRDGTVLRANIFRPADDGVYPIALTRTPYGKDFTTTSPWLDAVRLARAGYIVVIQDVRGRFASEGEWKPFTYEAQDGYDTVEWAARLPGANGKVGMWGVSYFGFTQWAAAREAPPSLKALVPLQTWADTRDGVSWRGGALELGVQAYWHGGFTSLDTLFKRLEGAAPAEQMRTLGLYAYQLDHLRDEGLWSLPLADFAPLKQQNLGAMFFESLANTYSRAYNAPYSIYEAYDRVQVPAYNVGSWYDIFCQGTIDTYTALRAGGTTPEARAAKLLIGPWLHGNLSSVFGDVDFGALAGDFINFQTDMTGLTQCWFDYWLKGIPNGVTDEPPVKLFIMGANVWRDENEWPLARTQYTPYYLHQHGRLSTEPPSDEKPDHYTYDPANPTPTWGGALLMNPLFGLGPKDQRQLDGRTDLLRYISEPLATDLEVTGPLIVKLWAGSDAPDTDFVARLIDVHPDGQALNLADGIIRARFRNGETPAFLQPGQPYEFTINLWATANVFKAGHRIRLDIASASFPRWDRNLNTGEDIPTGVHMRPARQTILHDAAHPSHISLPVIPGQR
jgi:hypothetical protein